MNRKLLLIGGGGHCKSVLDSLSATGFFAVIGIVDRRENTGKTVMGTSVIGCDDDLTELFLKGYTHAFISLGSIDNPEMRMEIHANLECIGFEIPNIIDSTAIVSKYAILEKGIYIGKHAIVNAGSYIYNGAIINTSSTIEHDCSIGAFSHIAPGVVLCGGVHIGECTHIGANSVVKQQVVIGSHALIGMGSVVLQNVADNTIAYGNPCKEVRSR